jgi:hypothetical protein
MRGPFIWSEVAVLYTREGSSGICSRRTEELPLNKYKGNTSKRPITLVIFTSKSRYKLVIITRNTSSGYYIKKARYNKVIDIVYI